MSEADTLRLCQASEDGGITYFAQLYDPARSTSLWAAYHLSRPKMRLVARSDYDRPGRFDRDPALESAGDGGPTHDDYTNSGFDRGHLAPAEAFEWDRGAFLATFRMSNVAPQESWFNRQLWEHLEDMERGWACDYGTLYVVTGVVFDDPAPTIGSGARRIHVPARFYKVYYSPADGGRAVAFLFDNAKPDASARREGIKAILARAALPVDAVEAVAGVDVLPGMPAALQRRVEAAERDAGFWRLSYKDNFTCTVDELAAAE